jgi:hypothetical protein
MEKTCIIDLYLEEFQEVIEEMLEKHIKDALKNKESGEELLTRDQVIKRLHIAPSTLSDYSNKGILIKYCIGRRVYYKWSEVLKAGIKVNK